MSEIPEDCPGLGKEESGHASACQGCPNQNTCQSGETPAPDPGIQLVASKLANVKHIVLVLSGKGGVGKSTVAAQLAYAFAKEPEKQVGLLDIDICGPSQPQLMNMQGEEVHASASGWSPVYHDEYSNLGVMSIGFLTPNSDEPIIWRGPRKNGLIKQFLSDVDWGELDYLVVDCPPGTSDEHLSIVTFLSGIPRAYGLVVTTPHQLSLLDVRKEIGFCKKTNIPIIGVVENMSGYLCPCCGTTTPLFPSNSGGAKTMCSEMGVELISTIPLEVGVGEAGYQGKPVNSESGVSSKLFGELAGSIETLINKKLS